MRKNEVILPTSHKINDKFWVKFKGRTVYFK